MFLLKYFSPGSKKNPDVDIDADAEPVPTLPWAHLPDLVIQCIIEYLVGSYYAFRKNLTYLAICHNWRHVGLPVVYNTAFIHCERDGKATYAWFTNIDLLRATGHFSLAKYLHIECDWWLSGNFSIKRLMIFLDNLNSEPVQWPSDYQDKLVRLDRLFAAEWEDDPPLVLNDELLEIVETTVRKFVEEFSGIQHLQLHLRRVDGTIRQFNSILVNSFAGRLSTLGAWDLYGCDLTNFSENLTSLSYKCSPYSFPLLPKINTLVLEKLFLSSLPLDFSWSLFQSDPVVFPNLVRLCLSWTSGDSARRLYAERYGLEMAVPDNQVGVRFPKLLHLSYFNIGNVVGFQPELIPSHLNSVNLTVSWASFCHFGKLPINSIETLSVAFNDAPEDVEVYYRAADRFFSRIGGSGKTNLIFNESGQIPLERAQWKNITSIRLDRLDTRKLVCIVCNMPQIKDIDVGGFQYRALDGNLIPRLVVNESKLEKLFIREFFYEQDIEIPICYFVLILQMFKNLQKVRLPKDSHEIIMAQIHKGTEGYSRLKELELKII